MSTVDAAQSFVRGPSTRQLVVGGVSIAVLGLAVGALLAIRANRPPSTPPITPVGLIGDPVPVAPPQTEETDAGVVVPIDPARRARARTVAARTPRPTAPTTPTITPTTPTTPRPTPTPPARTTPTPRPTEPNTTVERLPSGNTLRRDEQGNMVVYGSDGEPLVALDRRPVGTAVRDAGATSATPLPAPIAENGVIERGPRVSRGGYHLGDETDADGTMDPHVFQFVYRRYQPQIAQCWSTASRTGTVSGVIVVRVRIAEENGHVRSTRIISDSTGNAGLQACVQNTIRTWRYPQPEGGDVEVDYPLRFGGAR